MKSGKSSAKKSSKGNGTKKYLIAAAIFVVAGVFFAFFMSGYRFLSIAFFAAAAVTLALFAASLIHDKNPETEKRIKKIILFCVFTFCIVLAITEVTIVSDSRTTVTGDEPYAVLLGAGVNGETPSRILNWRIDAAEVYLKASPETICVLSGGKGPGENITEAECMYRELTARGIDGSRLIKEENSTNTAENIKYSMEIMKELAGGEEFSFAVITSDFHLCRALTTAYRQGAAATGVCAGTKLPVLAASNYFREAFGVWKLMFFG